MRTFAIVTAILFTTALAFDSKVSIQKDGTVVENEWEVTCGSLGEASTATFRVKVDTSQTFSTYDVQIVSQWTSASVVASQEEGIFQVGVGKGQVFRDLPVGVEHDLTVSNVYDTAGDHQSKFTAIIETGNWAWPDGHEFSSGGNVVSVSRRECSSGPTGGNLIASGNIETTSPAASGVVQTSLSLLALSVSTLAAFLW